MFSQFDALESDAISPLQQQYSMSSLLSIRIPAGARVFLHTERGSLASATLSAHEHAQLGVGHGAREPFPRLHIEEDELRASASK